MAPSSPNSHLVSIQTKKAGKDARRGYRWRVLATVLLLGVLVIAQQYWDNFHTVIPGQVYRGAQVSAASLQKFIPRYHLRSIINLRGPNVDDAWYQDERATAVRYGAQPYDLSPDSSYPPNPDELRELVTLLTSCQKPILIHCNSGIDRTSIVAAICVLALDDHGSLAKARGQLGLAYGQLPWRANFRRHQAFLDLYASWLGQHGFVTTPAHFQEWALHVYQPSPDLDNRVVPGLGAAIPSPPCTPLNSAIPVPASSACVSQPIIVSGCDNAVRPNGPTHESRHGGLFLIPRQEVCAHVKGAPAFSVAP
jgi:hypothetical protein